MGKKEARERDTNSRASPGVNPNALLKQRANGRQKAAAGKNNEAKSGRLTKKTAVRQVYVNSTSASAAATSSKAVEDDSKTKKAYKILTRERLPPGCATSGTRGGASSTSTATATTTTAAMTSGPSTSGSSPSDRSNKKMSAAASASSSSSMAAAGGARRRSKTKNDNVLPRQFNVLDEAKTLAELESQLIRPLKKRNPRHPNAILFCDACDYHLMSMYDAACHIKKDRHKQACTNQQLLAQLYCVPPPSVSHQEALNGFILHLAKEFGRSDGERKLCEQLSATLGELFRQKIPGVEGVRLYGSSVTCTAWKSSNVNLELLYDDRVVNHAEALSTAALLLTLPEEHGEIVQVWRDFQSRWPSVRFRCRIIPAAECVLSIRNGQAFQVGRLLSIYTKFRPEVATLAHFIRFWAKLCELDQWQVGLLPPYTFDLMLIHFLQKHNYLPVLHELSGHQWTAASATAYESDLSVIESHCDGSIVVKEQWNLAWLLIGFFRYFASELSVVAQIRQLADVTKEAKGWHRRRLAVEDPFLPNKNLSQLGSANTEYLNHCLRLAYCYFAVPQTLDGPLLVFDGQKMKLSELAEKMGLIEPKPSESPSSSESTGLTSSTQSCQDNLRRYGRDVLLALKPATLDQGLWKQLCQYGIGRTRGGDRRRVTVAQRLTASPPITETAPAASSASDAVVSANQNEHGAGGGTASFIESKNAVAVKDALAKLTADQLLFTFDGKMRFTGGMRPEKLCSYCSATDHSRADCPQLKFPQLKRLPRMSDSYCQFLRKLLGYMDGQHLVTERMIHMRDFVHGELLVVLRRIFPGENVRLDMFGSAKNGFGYAFSDLDFCLRFDSELLDKGKDAKVIIRKCAKAVRSLGRYQEVLAITEAKVPIVKFKRADFGLTGDISLYNVLALRNTDLLQTYSRLDERVPPLGRLVKSFAGINSIGDASRGGLSSYAWIIMLIHYLQNIEPPVLPVLQQLPPNLEATELPCEILDDWNTYFCANSSVIQEWRRRHQPNERSVIELLIGFFCYFTETEKFSLETDVVQIHRIQTLTKFEALWSDKPMTIQDPFDRNHNLSGGLSKRMFNYIVRCMIRAREVFGDSQIERYFHDVTQYYVRQHNGRPVAQDFMYYKKMEETMLYLLRLEDAPPLDQRQCRRCHRIGHYAERCPTLKKNADVESDESGDDEAQKEEDEERSREEEQNCSERDEEREEELKRVSPKDEEKQELSRESQKKKIEQHLKSAIGIGKSDSLKHDSEQQVPVAEGMEENCDVTDEMMANQLKHWSLAEFPKLTGESEQKKFTNSNAPNLSASSSWTGLRHRSAWNNNSVVNLASPKPTANPNILNGQTLHQWQQHQALMLLGLHQQQLQPVGVLHLQQQGQQLVPRPIPQMQIWPSHSPCGPVQHHLHHHKCQVIGPASTGRAPVAAAVGVGSAGRAVCPAPAPSSYAAYATVRPADGGPVHAGVAQHRPRSVLFQRNNVGRGMVDG